MESQSALIVHTGYIVHPEGESAKCQEGHRRVGVGATRAVNLAKREEPLASSLFQPIVINGVEIPNRIVKSAMAEGRCDAHGQPRPSLARLYERWARGGVGLAITGMAHIRRGYGLSGGEIGLYDDSFIEPLKGVTAAVHRHGGRIFAQLCHAPPQVPRQASLSYAAGAPSPRFNRTNLCFDPAIADDDLCRAVVEFGEAARRAREAGFDGVQFHGAHGYLLSRMISPLHNRRRDRWGGSFAARLAFLGEAYRSVRAAVGHDYPVTIKLNAHDGVPWGLKVRDSLRIARHLEAWGIDAIEVSAGTGDVGLGMYPNRGDMPVDLGKEWLLENFGFLRPVSPVLGLIIGATKPVVALRGEAFFEPLARRFAEAVDIPVICVGGIRSKVRAEKIVNESKVAMVSLARPLVREPDLANKWRDGTSGVARCVSCNRCFVQIGLGRRLACHQTLHQ